MTLTELKDKLTEAYNDLECTVGYSTVDIYEDSSRRYRLASFSVTGDNTISVDIPDNAAPKNTYWATPDLAFQFVSLFYKSQAILASRDLAQKTIVANKAAEIAASLDAIRTK